MSKQIPVPDDLLSLIEKREQPDRRAPEESRPAQETPPAPEDAAEDADSSSTAPSDEDRRKIIRRAEDRQPPR